MNEMTEHIYPTMGRHVGGMSAPVLTGYAREEVIRCPSCKKSHFDGEMRDGMAYCGRFHGWHARDDGFCHLAERREG